MKKLILFAGVMIFNVTIGAWSIIEILSWFGKDIPLIADIIGGLFLGQFTVPLAIFGWILRLCGIF